MSTESNWALRQHGRHINISTPPPSEIFLPAEARIRSPSLPQRHPTPPSYEIYPSSDGLRAASPPLNPWNPYLRSYGRVYPYGLGVNQYENQARNWLVSNEPSQRPLQHYPQSRVHIVPTFRDLNPHASALPLGESMRRTLSRPRSNRSFLHYRGSGSVGGGGGGGGHEMADDENNSGYSSLPVIEISSDEEEPRMMPVEMSTRPNSNNSSSARSSFNNHSNKENILHLQRFENAIRSPSHRTSAESKPNIHAQMRRTSSEDSIPSSANHFHHQNHQPNHHHHHQHHNYHQQDETSALNLSNRMKRPHRYSPPQSHPNKHYRINNEYRNSRQTPETTESHSADDESPPIQARKKPNVNEIDTTVNSTSASISQPITNDDNNIEQKFKIRIKREFKTEANSNSEIVDSETVVDTKEHLQPLIIADIKRE